MARNPFVKSRTEQIIEGRTGQTMADLLTSLYVDQGLTQAQVASRLGVSRQSVVGWMRRYDIASRADPKPEAAVA